MDREPADGDLGSPEVNAPRHRGARTALWFAVFLLILIALPFAIAVAYRWVPPPISMLMAIRLVQGSPIDYRWTPLGRISPHLAAAVISAEDARFCEHNGIDWKALHKVIEEPGGPSRGGSTIAMQTAKNLFLWPARSYVRKAVEMSLAWWIDFIWPKPRVIEVYLNIAEWGPGVFGAEAAAQHHFGKTADKLSARESALLAASLPNPHARNASRPGPKLRRLAGRIAKRVPATRPYLDCLRS